MKRGKDPFPKKGGSYNMYAPVVGIKRLPAAAILFVKTRQPPVVVEHETLEEPRQQQAGADGVCIHSEG